MDKEIIHVQRMNSWLYIREKFTHKKYLKVQKMCQFKSEKKTYIKHNLLLTKSKLRDVEVKNWA